MSILLVEDDEDIRLDLSELLLLEGYEVVSSSNGREALGLLRDGLSPSVILLDLMMPVMDGWEFRAEQLRDGAIAAIPVVLLSGAGDVRRHAEDLSASDFLAKPIKLDRLLATVRRYC